MEDHRSLFAQTGQRNSLVSLVQGLGIKVPLEPQPVKYSKENSISIVVKPRTAAQVSPRRTSPRPLSPRPGSPRLLSPRALSPRARSPKTTLRNTSPRLSSPRRAASPRTNVRTLRPASPRPLSPRPLSSRALSPRSILRNRPSTDRPMSPRARSPVSQRTGPVRTASPKVTRTLHASRFSLSAKIEAPPKRQLLGKPKSKPSIVSITPQPKQTKKVSFSNVATSKSQLTLPVKREEAASLTPQAMKELEASKAMVSPRIEFDTSRSQSPGQKALIPAVLEPAKKAKPILRTPKPKDVQSAVLNSLVTKVEATTDPSDAGKNKTEIITRKHLYQTFRGLKMARSLPLADPLQLQAKRVVLMKPPGKYRRKTAIFDLDETLVHCLDRSETAVPDVVLPIRFPNGDIVHVTSTQARMKIRPYCTECLTQVSEEMELIVFTASQRSYADAIMNYIDPTRTLIHHRLYRENCIVSDRVHIKDLRIFANRSLKDVVLVDNAAYSFGYQIDNGIPIISWHDDPDDKELLYLMQYLRSLLSVDDVREVNQTTFHLSTFYDDYSEEFLCKAKLK